MKIKSQYDNSAELRTTAVELRSTVQEILRTLEAHEHRYCIPRRMFWLTNALWASIVLVLLAHGRLGQAIKLAIAAMFARG